jgi:hypothetical protein
MGSNSMPLSGSKLAGMYMVLNHVLECFESVNPLCNAVIGNRGRKIFGEFFTFLPGNADKNGGQPWD